MDAGTVVAGLAVVGFVYFIYTRIKASKKRRSEGGGGSGGGGGGSGNPPQHPK